MYEVHTSKDNRTLQKANQHIIYTYIMYTIYSMNDIIVQANLHECIEKQAPSDADALVQGGPVRKSLMPVLGQESHHSLRQCMQCISDNIFRLVAKHWLIIGFEGKINRSGLVDRLVDTKIYINLYTRYTRYIQDIQDIYKIPRGGQAAAARPGPAPRRRLAAAWYFVYVLYILYISCIYLVYELIYQPCQNG